MDDERLDIAFRSAEDVERDIRRHLSMESGAFEQARGMAAYRAAVALRKALELWITTRAHAPRQG